MRARPVDGLRRGTVAKVLALLGLAASLVVLAFASPAYAATRQVSTTGADAGNCLINPCRTVAYAYTQAVSGDVINVAPGTYTHTLATHANLGPKAAGFTVTIQGAGAANTIIEASATPPTLAAGATTSVFVVFPGAGNNVIFNDLTLRHGRPTVQGGALTLNNGNTTVNNSVLTNNLVRVNTFAVGGAVSVQAAATFTADNVTFSNNATQNAPTALNGSGGAIWGAGRITVRNSSFTNNVAGSNFATPTPVLTGNGGAIANWHTAAGQALVVENSTFTGNRAANGGAITSIANTRATLTGNTIGTADAGGGNTATTGVAGGVHSIGTQLTIDGGSVTGNTAATNGGGVWFNGATMTLSETAVLNNVANGTANPSGGGGLLWAGTGLGSVSGSTISGNAGATGGGIWVFTNGLTVSDSDVDGNTGAAGGGIATLGLPGLGAPHPSVSVINSSVSENDATGPAGGIGGGLFLANAATLTNVDVNGNQAHAVPDGADANTQPDGGLAGGVGIFGGTLTATDSSISGNIARNAGGLLTWPTVNAVAATLTRTAVDGNTADAAGSSIQTGPNDGGDIGGGNGGGIYQLGGTSVTLTDSSVSDNHAIPGPDGGDSGPTVDGGNGGGILSQGNGVAFPAVSVIRSAVNGNHASTGSGIFNLFSNVSVRDSTVSENATDPGSGTLVHFGGLMTIAGSTITENTSAAALGYGGIVALTTGAGAAGSIIRDNTPPDCTNSAVLFSSVNDGGYNASDDPGCAFTNNVVTGDPQLGELALNGGSTENRLPAPTSPVINKIPVGTIATFNDAVTNAAINLCPGVDQRGVARPSGPSCDIGSVEVGNVAPELSGNEFPVFLVGTAGSETYVATGVPAPATIAYSGDPLPTGVTFVDNGDGTGTLAGTPADDTGGVYEFTLTASNGISPDDALDVTLTVNEAPEITGPTSPTFVEGVSDTSFDYTTDGFPAPASITSSGDLPAGVSLIDNGNGTATLSGTPDAGTVGSYPITIIADNGEGIPDGTLAVTVVVNPAVNIVTTALPNAQVGAAYSTLIVAENGSPPYSFTVSDGSLPPGLVLATDGAITGTPTSAGVYTFDVTVTDDIGQTDTQTLSITVDRGVSRLVADKVVLRVIGGAIIRITVGQVSATLTGGDANAPIPGQTLVFSAGATPVCTAVTGADGRATCSTGALATIQLIAAGGVTVTYAGNDDWLPSSAFGGLL